MNEIRLPEKFQCLFQPARHKAFHGGRGGAKSHSIATGLLVLATKRPLRVLCCREIQDSIKSSVKQLLDDKIAELGLGDFFRSTDREIKAPNGSLFTFTGLRTTDAAKVKSFEGYDIAWVEEAHSVSKRSVEILLPTIRKPQSEIWWSWNRTKAEDYVDQLFIGSGEPPKNSIVVQTNWADNPWFPDVLREEMERDKRLDHEYYLHKWEGHLRQRSDAAVFKQPEIKDLDDKIPPLCHPRHGADWGMRDPTVLVRCYLWKNGDGSTTLYIAREVYKLGCEIEEIPSLFAGPCPHPVEWHVERRWFNRGHHGLLWGNSNRSDILQHRIIGDSASPETIKYLRNRGFQIIPAIKGAGSIEEGVRFIQMCKVVIHPDCRKAIEEWNRYSYKIDKDTEEVLPELDDVDNHVVDAVRYAVEQDRRRAATHNGALVKPILVTAD